MPAKNITNNTAKSAKRETRKRMLTEFWFYFSENRGAVIGLWVFLFLIDKLQGW